MAELHAKYGPNKLNFVYLNVRDEGASQIELYDHLARVGMPTEYLIMDDVSARALTNAADDAVPRTLIFDRSGQPLGKITGYKPMALARISGLVEQ